MNIGGAASVFSRTVENPRIEESHLRPLYYHPEDNCDFDADHYIPVGLVEVKKPGSYSFFKEHCEDYGCPHPDSKSVSQCEHFHPKLVYRDINIYQRMLNGRIMSSNEDVFFDVERGFYKGKIKDFENHSVIKESDTINYEVLSKKMDFFETFVFSKSKGDFFLFENKYACPLKNSSDKVIGFAKILQNDHQDAQISSVTDVNYLEANLYIEFGGKIMESFDCLVEFDKETNCRFLEFSAHEPDQNPFIEAKNPTSDLARHIFEIIQPVEIVNDEGVLSCSDLR